MALRGASPRCCPKGGNFQVFIDRHYLRIVFRICLHIDDIEVLYRIKNLLGVGSVTSKKNYCVYSIANVNDLLTVLFPILDQYVLYTTKWLDYLDFKTVALYLSTATTTRLSAERLIWINSIMQGMNSTRTEYNYNLITKLTVVEPFWFLGGLRLLRLLRQEGEGTFGFKNLVPYFQVGQHTKNLMVLNAITAFLQSLPKTFTFTLNSLPPIVSEFINHTTSVAVLNISSIDALYDYLMFFLLDMPFQSRKSIDFLYWSLGLHFHKLGYFYLPVRQGEGRELLSKIAQHINSSASQPFG